MRSPRRSGIATLHRRIGETPQFPTAIAALSSRLYGTEVQFFANYRVADMYAWGRAREGKCG